MKVAKPKKRLIQKRALAILVTICALVVIDYFAYPNGNYLDGKSTNQGKNGLWLRYTWYFGEHSNGEEIQLASKLQREQIRYAYFHVRFMEKTGKLRFHFPGAKSLTSTLHRSARAVRLLAWIYVDGPVRLNDSEVRRSMVGEAKWLVETCGFDGVQWDYEPCPDGDAGFLSLLDDIQAALPHSMLSVASPTWFPWPASGFGWSESYFGNVGKRCDQIAVMCKTPASFCPDPTPGSFGSREREFRRRPVAKCCSDCQPTKPGARRITLGPRT